MFKAYGDFWKRYAKFQGRTDRKGFWLAMLANSIIGIPLMILAFAGDEEFGRMIPYLLFFYATLIPFFAICRRRLRDAGLKGSNLWWFILPYVGWVVLIVKFCKPSAAEEVIPAGAEVPVIKSVSKNTVCSEDDNIVKVMSTSPYRAPGQEHSYSGNVFGILVSIGLILGGASGNFVLRGTNSSGALVAAGFAFLILDIIKLISTKKAYEKADMEDAHNRTLARRAVTEAAHCEEQLSKQITVHLLYDEDVPALDYGATFNGNRMDKESNSETRYTVTSSKRNVLSFNCLNLTAILDINDIVGNDVYIRLFRQGTDFGIALPSCISLVKNAA